MMNEIQYIAAYFIVYLVVSIFMITIYIAGRHKEGAMIDSDMMFVAVGASMFLSLLWPLVMVFIFIWNASALILRLATRNNTPNQKDAPAEK